MQWRDREGIETAAIAALLPLVGKNVLDVGCGTGRLTAFAASRAASVYAFDPSDEKVSEARAELPHELRHRVRFAVHGAEALDLPRTRFDIALCGWSLWCIPLEGVVHALHRIHAALVPDGTLIDTQPVSPRPPIFSNGLRLGTLDMREWLETVNAVDELAAEPIDTGLYALEREQRLIVTDTYDNGPELVETVSDWRGTRISRTLSARVASAESPLTLRQEVRLRLLRRRA